jgi:hypothetical protein
MRTWLIAVLSLAFAAGCAMQAGSADDRVGPDGQPLGAANDTVATPEGTGTGGTTAASIRECNSPDPQPWNCPSVHPNTGSGANSGTKSTPHDVYGNTGSDVPGGTTGDQAQ